MEGIGDINDGIADGIAVIIDGAIECRFDGSKLGLDEGIEVGFVLLTIEGFEDAVKLGEKLGKLVGTKDNDG